MPRLALLIFLGLVLLVLTKCGRQLLSNADVSTSHGPSTGCIGVNPSSADHAGVDETRASRVSRDDSMELDAQVRHVGRDRSDIVCFWGLVRAVLCSYLLTSHNVKICA